MAHINHYLRKRYGLDVVSPRTSSLSYRMLLRRCKRMRSGCIIWMGARSGNYGQISDKGKLVRVHRLVFELRVGDIHDLRLHNLCGNTLCVNVHHWEPRYPMSLLHDLKRQVD